MSRSVTTPRLAVVETTVRLAAELAGGHAFERMLDETGPHPAVVRRRLVSPIFRKMGRRPD